MNSTLYYDHLETRHAPLACNPNGGDPEYAFVCWYTLEFVASWYILIAAWLYISAYRKVRLDSSKTTGAKSVTQSSATATSATLMHPRVASHFVRFALTTGTLVLLAGLALIGGAGTKYGLEEFRGQLGDTCCKSDLVRLKVWHAIQCSSRRTGMPF
jgi:hypothetical protein